MGIADSAPVAKPRVHCLVPPDLPPRVLDSLRSHFGKGFRVSVIADRRRRERRVTGDRRADREWSADPHAARGQTRRIRNADGRRVADRRAPTVALDPPALAIELPRGTRRYARRLAFVQVSPLSDQQRFDAEVDRLALRFQGGEEKALLEIHRRFSGTFYGYAKSVLMDEHEVQDIVQEMYLRMWMAIGDFELSPGSHYSSWLRSVAWNLIIDAQRLRERVEVVDPFTLAQEMEGPGDLGAEVNGWITDPAIAFQVERLPEVQRRIIFLRYALDYSTEQIARLTNRSRGTIRKQQSNALLALQERLTRTGDAERLRSRHLETLIRIRPARVMSRRRFALTGGFTPAGALMAAATRRYAGTPSLRQGRW